MDIKSAIKTLNTLLKRSTTDKRVKNMSYIITKEEEKAVKQVIALLKDCV